ncbi:hypothetical protein P280DRAFT_466689 [Massarina eburnea CBS 473.64]|uniref:Secreted protein n=1 Tax=Massarina eburnea CBS 473.64 TaxID=1395130 RepID=A0A6A6S8A5_9PLEO|nr:hypothetical protein P280DRAFT_466689 [Massarina eburnea CBS 473.64]
MGDCLVMSFTVLLTCTPSVSPVIVRSMSVSVDRRLRVFCELTSGILQCRLSYIPNRKSCRNRAAQRVWLGAEVFAWDARLSLRFDAGEVGASW